MNSNLRSLLSLATLVLAVISFSAHAGTTSYFIYDESGHVIGEYDANGNAIQEHVYLGDRPVAVVQGGSSSGGTVDYVTTDQLNTPRVITDSSQTVLWSWNSDPFGNGNPTGSLTYDFRFPGQQYDSETGHNYNYFRDYDSITGRYTESDPIGLGGGVNTYIYADDNSVKNRDPSGKNPLGAAVATDLVLGGPENPFADAAAAVVYVGSAAWAAYELSQAMNDDEPCDKDKQCEQQLEREEALCEAAGARYPGNPEQAVTVCRKAAINRYAQCLKGVPESERQPLTGIDTPDLIGIQTMKVADVLTNEFLVRYDENSQRLLIYTLKDGQPVSDVPIVSRLSMLEDMGKSEASRWVGETLLILIPTMRERLFGVHD